MSGGQLTDAVGCPLRLTTSPNSLSGSAWRIRCLKPPPRSSIDVRKRDDRTLGSYPRAVPGFLLGHRLSPLWAHFLLGALSPERPWNIPARSLILPVLRLVRTTMPIRSPQRTGLFSWRPRLDMLRFVSGRQRGVRSSWLRPQVKRQLSSMGLNRAWLNRFLSAAHEPV